MVWARTPPPCLPRGGEALEGPQTPILSCDVPGRASPSECVTLFESVSVFEYTFVFECVCCVSVFAFVSLFEPAFVFECASAPECFLGLPVSVPVNQRVCASLPPSRSVGVRLCVQRAGVYAVFF